MERVGRSAVFPGVGSFSDYLLDTLSVNSKASLNLQVQAVRILAYRAKQLGQTAGLATGLHTALRHRQPRLRFAAVGAMHETRQSAVVPELLATLQHESDTAVFYAGWQALRALQSTSQLRTLLSDSRSAVRRAALLGLLESHASNQTEVRKLAEHDPAADVREVAELWLAKKRKGIQTRDSRKSPVAGRHGIRQQCPIERFDAGRPET